MADEERLDEWELEERREPGMLWAGSGVAPAAF